MRCELVDELAYLFGYEREGPPTHSWTVLPLACAAREGDASQETDVG